MDEERLIRLDLGVTVDINRDRLRLARRAGEVQCPRGGGVVTDGTAGTVAILLLAIVVFAVLGLAVFAVVLGAAVILAVHVGVV